MVYTNELCHHGIKGQKWGVRRFQNADGSRTSAGKKHENESRAIIRKTRKAFDKAYSVHVETDDLTSTEATRMLCDDSNFKKAVAPILKQADDVRAKYIGKHASEIDFHQYARDMSVLDDATSDLCYKMKLSTRGRKDAPDAERRVSFMRNCVAQALDEHTGDPSVGDVVIHGDPKMYLQTSNYLIHHGIKGQKWGIRRFQNPDGSRTPAGAVRELKRYQQRELHTLDRMNRKQTRKEDRQIAKAQIKMARLATKGGPLFRKTLVAKRQNQIDNLKQKKLYRQGIYASERARVMRMTIDDVDRERAGLMKNRGERSVMQMFSKGRLDREFKTSQRVTEEQRQNAYSNAYMLRSAMG